MNNLEKIWLYKNYLSCLTSTLLNFMFNKMPRMPCMKHNLTTLKEGNSISFSRYICEYMNSGLSGETPNI